MRIAVKYANQRNQLEDPIFLRDLLNQNQREKLAASTFVVETEYVGQQYHYCVDSIFRSKSVNIYQHLHPKLTYPKVTIVKDDE